MYCIRFQSLSSPEKEPTSPSHPWSRSKRKNALEAETVGRQSAATVPVSWSGFIFPHSGVLVDIRGDAQHRAPEGRTGNRKPDQATRFPESTNKAQSMTPNQETRTNAVYLEFSLSLLRSPSTSLPLPHATSLSSALPQPRSPFTLSLPRTRSSGRGYVEKQNPFDPRSGGGVCV